MLLPPSLGIFWDTISRPIPDGVNPGDVLDNIIAALRVHFPDYDHEIHRDAVSFGLKRQSRRADVVLIFIDEHHRTFFYVFEKIGSRRAFVLPLSDPAASGYCQFPDLLLLDWLWVSRGSGKIITRDDFGSVAAAAPVAGDAEAVEGHTSGLCHHVRDGALSDEEVNDFQVKCFSSPQQPYEIVGIKRRRSYVKESLNMV
ncbi:hypothetical protein MLD38_036036 [Melastoma candidum]|uniref:Uncharacterized protein n=1 Tax=Melastoma candidum TaxID=119954 RepID=A0ACB9LJM0_9MYRT|nr:hypothetical protein MLD38_036036 [Melastoma candidum]